MNKTVDERIYIFRQFVRAELKSMRANSRWQERWLDRRMTGYRLKWCFQKMERRKAFGASTCDECEREMGDEMRVINRASASDLGWQMEVGKWTPL